MAVLRASRLAAAALMASVAAAAAGTLHGQGTLMRAERAAAAADAEVDLALTADVCRTAPGLCRCAHRRRNPILKVDADEGPSGSRRRCLDAMGRTGCTEKTGDVCLQEAASLLEEEAAGEAGEQGEQGEQGDEEPEEEPEEDAAAEPEAPQEQGRGRGRRGHDEGSMRRAAVLLRSNRTGRSSGRYFAGKGVAGDLKCKKSYWQNLWTRKCEWCAGTTRRRRAFSCDGCIMGYYKALSTYAEHCTVCEGGTVRRRRATYCTSCSNGYFNPIDSEDCVKCPGPAISERRRRMASECIDTRALVEDTAAP